MASNEDDAMMTDTGQPPQQPQPAFHPEHELQSHQQPQSPYPQQPQFPSSHQPDQESAAASSSAAAAAAASSSAIPSSLPQSSDPSLAARVFAYRSSCLNVLAQYQTHHLIPHSGKVVIFDSQLVVKHAFDGMVHHDLSCAPVWDSYKKKYVGLLSVSDFLDILMSTYSNSDRAMFDNLSNQRICDWAEYKKQRGTSINRLLCISPEATLHEAVRQLLNYRVHRLCVVQLALADTVLRIITNHGILRFLRNNCPIELSSSISIRELGIGVFQNLLTLTYTTPVSKALELLSAYKVSSIPIVDENNKPIDVYSRADVRYLALDQTWRNLDMTIEEALSKHRRGRALPLCSRDDSVHTVSGLLVSSMRHSLICVHEDGTIEGVVSLTDIFSFLLNSSAPAAESRIAALKQDYAKFEEEEERRLQQLQLEQQQRQQQQGGQLAASPTLLAEELLKQRNFLSDHGNANDDFVEDELMMHDGADGAPAQLHNAIAAGTASAARHHGLRVQGYSSAPPMMSSPAIQPTKPNDDVPADMDFLG